MKKVAIFFIILFASLTLTKIISSEDVEASAKASDQYKATDWCPSKGGGCFHLDEVVIVATK